MNNDENIWESEYPTEEEVEQNLKRQQAQFKSPPIQEYQQNQDVVYTETTAIDDVFDLSEEDDKELLQNASLRLEQGQLYQLLLKHDLFGEVNADPRAIAKVQKELRSFIKEKLEIMLGMRPDPKIMPVTIQTGSQFSDVEVDFLRRVVTKALGNNEVKSIPAPQISEKPKVNSIKKISQPIAKPIQPKPEAIKAPQQKPVQKAESKPAPQPQKQPTSPVQINKSREEYLYSKPLNELTRAEIEERNEIISQKQRGMKSFGMAHKRAPMPSLSEQYRMAVQQVDARLKSTKNAGHVSTILGHFKKEGTLE